MSVSLILIPAALAAAAVIQARAGGGGTSTVCTVSTRMRDSALLSAALRETGALVTDVDADTVDAAWQGVESRFTRGADGIWTAHFRGDVDEVRAVEIVRRLDAAYGRQVQAAVVARLRDRAPAAGLRLESETVAEDEAVRLVFAVEREERA
jgi:hypothetical protein